MATRDIVPNGNNEGSLGTDVRRWAGGHFEVLKKAGQNVSVEGHEHTAADIVDFEEAVNEAVSIGPNSDASLLTQGTLPDERLSSAVQTSLGKADTSSQPGHTHTLSDLPTALGLYYRIDVASIPFTGSLFYAGESNGKPLWRAGDSDQTTLSWSGSQWRLYPGVAGGYIWYYSNDEDLLTASWTAGNPASAGTTPTLSFHLFSTAALSKSAVGLGNVDNTSDADKPISNATALALDSKAQPAALLGSRYKGEYDNGADYNIGDVVSLGGVLYVRILEPNPGYPPGTEYWGLWNLTKSDLGLGNVDNTSDLNKPVSTATQTALNAKADLENGKVLSTQLPSYVDDVIEVANEAARPATGETGKIYVTLNNNKCWRWSGSAYVEISPSPGSTDSVPEGSTNLYHTTARAAAAAPVQSVAGRSGNVTLQKSDVGLSNVDNTSDVSKPISTATQSALNLKVDSTDARLTDARFQTLLSRVAWVYDAVNYQIVSETTSLAGRTDGATTPTITAYNQNGGVGNGHVYRFNIAATSPTNTPRQCSDICVLRSAFTNTAPFFMQSNVARGVIEYSRPFAVSFRVAGPNIAFGEFFFGIGYTVPSLSNAAGATIPDLPDKGFGLRLQRNTSVSNTWNASAFYRTSSAASQTFTSSVTVSPVSNVYQFVLYWTGSGLEVYQYNGSTLTSVTSFTGVNLGTSAANNVNWLMGVAPLNSAGQMQYDVQPPVITWF